MRAHKVGDPMASSSGSSRASSSASSRRKPARSAKSVSADKSKERPDTPSRPQVSFLTVAEVAELMRVSKMTVYRLVHAGDLTAVRVGRSFRVPEEAVHAYLRDAYIEAG